MFAAYLVATAGTLGFKKERDRIDVLANRLSMDRNISLELPTPADGGQDSLRPADSSSLSSIQNSNSIIQNRIVESYMVGLCHKTMTSSWSCSPRTRRTRKL